MMFAWCYAIRMFTLVAALGAATVETPLCNPPTSIECTLQTAGVHDPAAMTESLIHSELRTVGDVVELNTVEAEEMFDGLRAAVVPLGDRARLWKVAWVHWDREQANGPGEHSTMMFHSDRLPPSHKRISDKTIGKKTTNAPHRHMQSGGGVSIEVVAIAFTGLIGMVGYAVQALDKRLPCA
jgi:hypothetical protein